MKLKVFEVVELLNENKAIILNSNEHKYKAQVFNKEGENLGAKDITELDIKKILISK